MTTFYRLIQGHVLSVLPSLPAESVNLVVTSPPYWGLRSYPEAEAVWGGSEDCEHVYSVSNKVENILKESVGDWDRPSRRENAKVGSALGCAVCGKEIKGKLNQKFCSTKCLNTLSNDDRTNLQPKQPFCVKCGGWRGQLGLEPHPSLYIQHLVEIARELKRVLRKDGSFYLNLGDTYYGGGGNSSKYKRGPQSCVSQNTDKLFPEKSVTNSKIRSNWLQPKQLLGMPWRVAIALQGEGWILRNANVWHKPNAMPSSVKDRLNNTYEFVFHFAKNRKYWYDLDAIRVAPVEYELKRRLREKAQGLVTRFKEQKMDGLVNPPSQKSGLRTNVKSDTYLTRGKNPGDVYKSEAGQYAYGGRHSGYFNEDGTPRFNPKSKNPGDFWKVPTKPFRDAHFAVFPPALIEPIIKSSCPVGGVVLDPFVGSGTTMLVARDLARSCIGIDVVEDYCEMARRRVFGKQYLDREVEYSFEVIK